jgi:NAD(P)-dependent dehydrogenase (short-subunit alcohol dehydrogenase family)
MPDKPVALVTGANQGIGLQIAKDLVPHGVTVLVGSRSVASFWLARSRNYLIGSRRPIRYEFLSP